jgi:hypothetical protein
VKRHPRDLAGLPESLARALIEEAGRKFGVSHNRGQMAAALPEDHAWREDIRSLDHLSRHATAHRYLESGRLAEPPDRDERIADLERIEGLSTRARTFLKLPPRRDPRMEKS